MEDKKYISSVKLPDNDIPFYLKDLDARAFLERLLGEEVILYCGTAEELLEGNIQDTTD